MRLCPRCKNELMIMGADPEGYDIWGCPDKECGYIEGVSEEDFEYFRKYVER